MGNHYCINWVVLADIIHVHDNTNEVTIDLTIAVGTDVDDYGDLISNEVIPDTYSSLQRGPRLRGGGRAPAGLGGAAGNVDQQTLYGTYRPHNRHYRGRRHSSKYEYSNFASSFEDEFDLKHFQSRKSDPTSYHFERYGLILSKIDILHFFEILQVSQNGLYECMYIVQSWDG